MFRLLAWLVCGIAIGATWLCGPASAQIFDAPKPASDTGGYANTELRQIYQRSIGRGYSVDSVNRISLNTARAGISNVGQMSTSYGRIGLGLESSSPSSKPFSGYSSSPTVSPWLNLFREDLDGSSDLNYQTLVRPQLQQQRFNEQMQRQGMEISQRLQAISAQSAFNSQGSLSQPPTGHQTVFMYYGRYYPAMNTRRR